MPILCRFVSGFQKCHLFLCTAIRNAKKCISIMWRHHLYLFFFWPLHSKNKDIVLQFCVRVVFMYLDHIYYDFLDKLETLHCIDNYFLKKRNFGLGGPKSKNIENPRQPFCRAFNLKPFEIFRLCFTSKRNILAVFKYLQFLIQNGETWRHQNAVFSTKFRRTFLKFGWQTSKWCGQGTKGLASISIAVFELSRKSGRGRNPPPPPAGRVLTCHSIAPIRRWEKPRA